MKIGIVGYGVMGKLVAKAVLDRGHQIAAIIDPSASNAHAKRVAELSPEKAQNIDVLIDFSSPDSALSNIEAALKIGLPLVMATTGWYDKMDEMKSKVEAQDGALVWGSNFSVGVNLFWKIVEEASKNMNNQKDYDVFVHEFHHKRKKDSPSGTAINAAEKILANLDRKKRLVTERLDRAIEEDELHVSSTRGGDVPGTHQVYFDSPFDTIEISHTARSREGFALGSVIAAEWLFGKKGFYSFAEKFTEICNNN